MGAFDPSSTSRAVRSSWGVCEGGGAPAWPGAAFWWCLFREHGLSSVRVCVNLLSLDAPTLSSYPRGYLIASPFLSWHGTEFSGAVVQLRFLLNSSKLRLPLWRHSSALRWSIRS